MTTVNWRYNHIEITDIKQFPEDCIGFIYLITFDDNTKYIGKKSLYVYRNLTGNPPKGYEMVKEFKKNSGGYRIRYLRCRKESNWKKYQGSCLECKKKKVKERKILDFATMKQELTYKEVKYQMIFNVLKNNNFLNDNILGKFYRNLEVTYSTMNNSIITI